MFLALHYTASDIRILKQKPVKEMKIKRKGTKT